MSDTLTKENRRKAMQSIKSKKTKIENKVTSELWRRGIRFRRNVDNLYGKPDIAIKKYKIVIFIDSCFWHGCILHCRLPKSNKEYWIKKIERNINRDLEVNNYYREKGWHLMRVWEHELKDNYGNIMDGLEKFIRLYTN